jgi:transposase
MKGHILGIDLAKNVFHLHGVDRKGRAVLVRRVRRELLLKVLGEMEPCLIGIEASTGAFYWQRQFEKLGHAVKIMAPQYVNPFVRRQKNDSNDAEVNELRRRRGYNRATVAVANKNARVIWAVLISGEPYRAAA